MINPESILRIDSNRNCKGTVIVDNDDKLKVNLSSDFTTDCNNAIVLNYGSGLYADSNNCVSVFKTKD